MHYDSDYKYRENKYLLGLIKPPGPRGKLTR